MILQKRQSALQGPAGPRGADRRHVDRELAYWGFNQYIIQRALAAKSLDEAQKGVVFAAFLKLLMPVIIVLPGIAAVVLAPGPAPSPTKPIRR